MFGKVIITPLKVYILYSLKHPGEVFHFHFNRSSTALLYLHVRYLITLLTYVLISTAYLKYLLSESGLYMHRFYSE